MASVQLSLRLRDDICQAFSIQLGKAYRKSYDIQTTLDTVLSVNASPSSIKAYLPST